MPLRRGFGVAVAGRQWTFNNPRALPVLKSVVVAAFGAGLVALAAPQAPAGLQVRILVGAFEAAGFALGPALVGILLAERAAHGLGGGRAGGAQQQPQQQAQAKE